MAVWQVAIRTCFVYNRASILQAWAIIGGAMSALNKQRDDIQGLRALAVLAVIVFHANSSWLPGGFVGVDIFFVLSGYLITGIVLKQKAQGTFNLLSFYGSRVRRIVPAYLTLLAVVAIAMAILLIPRDFDSFHDSLKSAAYFNSNNYFNQQNDYFAPASHELPLLHTWSLAIEMQFYVFLPAVVMLIPTRFIKVALVLALLALLGYSQMLLQQGEKQSVYFSLLARIPEFLVGSVLAAWGTRQVGNYSNLKAGAGLLLLVLSVALISQASAFPGLLAMLPCIGTALLISAQGSAINRCLAGRSLVFIGGLSYSLYLWHWPVLAGMRYYFERYELPYAALAIAAVLILALSLCSYYCIERPLRGATGRKGTLKLVACFAAVVVVVLGAKALNPVLVPPLPVELTRYAAPGTICHGEMVGECLHGDLGASKEILLLGDSHGAQLNNFADVVGTALHARIRVITASSCVPITGFDQERLPEWSRPPCAAQIAMVQKYLAGADALIIAGMWQYQAPSAPFLQALDRFLGDAAARDQPVMVLAQVPMLTSNVQRMYRFNELGGSRAAQLEKTWAPANEKIKALVSKYPNGAFFEPAGLALFATPPIAEGRLIYQDDHHLNEVGSRAYGMVAAGPLANTLLRLEQVVAKEKLARLQRQDTVH